MLASRTSFRRVQKSTLNRTMKPSRGKYTRLSGHNCSWLVGEVVQADARTEKIVVRIIPPNQRINALRLVGFLSVPSDVLNCPSVCHWPTYPPVQLSQAWRQSAKRHRM